MEPKGSFGPRLRQERERRQISLESIAANTKISVSLLQGLERDDVKRWPAGIFRRSFVRAYAQAIGMDPDAVLRDFLERFPDPGAAPDPAAVPQEDAPAAVQTASTLPQSSARITNTPNETVIVVRVTIPRAWLSWLRWPWPSRSGA